MYVFDVGILSEGGCSDGQEQGKGNQTGGCPEPERQGSQPNGNITPSFGYPALEPALVPARHRDHELIEDVSTA